MAAITTGQNMPVFHIFLLEKLFFELRNACGQYSNDVEHSVFPTTGIPIMELEKEVFSSTYNLACMVSALFSFVIENLA